MRTCSFCGEEIEDGTGKMYVKKTVQYTISAVVNVKKEIKLKRLPRKVKWVKK